MHSCSPPLAHRDIKIENVLFQADRCKLCDFGSASTIRLDFRYFEGIILAKSTSMSLLIMMRSSKRIQP